MSKHDHYLVKIINCIKLIFFTLQLRLIKTPIIKKHTIAQITVLIFEHNIEDFTDQNKLNRETENKATPVSSTALTSIFSKAQVRLLPVYFKFSHVYQCYKLHINIINESFKHCFAT